MTLGDTGTRRRVLGLQGLAPILIVALATGAALWGGESPGGSEPRGGAADREDPASSEPALAAVPATRTEKVGGRANPCRCSLRIEPEDEPTR